MKALGIILAGGNSSRMQNLSEKRAISAMSVACSYRCIDFVLSNMTNSNIQTVAVLSQYNARSLNEHLNSSKWWNFGRKQGGLFLFTPTVTSDNSWVYRGNADAMCQNIDFLKKRHEPYVVIATGVYVIRRRTLIELLEQSNEEGRYNFVTDVLIRQKGLKKIYGYMLDGYWSNIASVESYYRTNMDFLKKDIRDYFFHQEPQIYSKAYDLPPAKYNAGSKVSNSLIASGCIINSTVEDSVLFKKVFVGNNRVIKNSIIMNGAYIGDNVYIENCIVESSETLLSGSKYVGEGQIRIVSEKKKRYEAHQTNGEG